MMEPPTDFTESVPQGFADATAPINASTLERMIRTYWHLLLIGGGILWLFYRKIENRIHNIAESRTSAKLEEQVQSNAVANAERLKAAREKAFLAAEEDKLKYLAKRAETDRQRLEEEKQKQDARNSVEFTGTGRRLGSGSPKSNEPTSSFAAARAVATARPESSDVQQLNESTAAEPREKLPKLPGGDRQRYTPMSADRPDGGYRPNRRLPSCPYNT